MLVLWDDDDDDDGKRRLKDISDAKASSFAWIRMSVQSMECRFPARSTFLCLFRHNFVSSGGVGGVPLPPLFLCVPLHS